MATDREPATETDTRATETLATELQRKFGLCLLRLQRYELLGKEVLSGSVLETVGQTVIAQRKTKSGAIASMTLGPLVNEIISSVVRSDTAPEEPEPQISGDPTQVRITTRFARELSAEEHTRFKVRLEAFVDLRNELAHHFLQKFDVSSDRGCRAAITHLDQCLSKVDAELVELNGLASGMREMMAMQAQVLSQIDPLWLVAPALPGDGPDRFGPDHELVTWLKRAECVARKDGWTSLSAAGGYIRKQAPELRLKDHKVAKWSQVLERSQAFETRVDFSNQGASSQMWYRSPPQCP